VKGGGTKIAQGRCHHNCRQETLMTTPSDTTASPEEDKEAPPADVSVPIGDAIPTPVEPGLDQPLPEKNVASAEATPAPGAPDAEPDAAPGNDISKPVGDAIPTPVEPGTDQPLPDKSE
jgi:hypothetical protein